MSEIRVLFKRTHKNAQLPAAQTEYSSGLDLHSVEEVTLNPGEKTLIQTGLSVSIPHGFEGQIRSRSGLALKNHVSVVNSPGTIDSDYRGELGVILQNQGSEGVFLPVGSRVAQLVICPVITVNNGLVLEEVSNLDNPETRNGGFGSTGV